MQFANALLGWYNQNKRDLPWRNTPTPYHIWISEIILQQTRVVQGIDYYYRFLEAFPTIEELAKAEEQKVLNLWQGLGYYSRARNLHKAAKLLVGEYGGALPKTFIELKKIPGIGPYTAAAIASIAFNEAVPAIDGNAYRVYSRFLGIYEDISGGKAFNVFFEAGKALMPEKNTGDFNQAIMELGATVCVPQNPLCMFCPVQEGCFAFQKGEVSKLPVKTKKVKVKEEKIIYFYVYCDEQFLIHHRNKKGIWQNMYDFPTYAQLKKDIKIDELSPFESVEHILTHKKLSIDFIKLSLEKEEFQSLAKKHHLKMVNGITIEDFPTPKPITEFIKKHIQCK